MYCHKRFTLEIFSFKPPLQLLLALQTYTFKLKYSKKISHLFICYIYMTAYIYYLETITEDQLLSLRLVSECLESKQEKNTKKVDIMKGQCCSKITLILL